MKTKHLKARFPNILLVACGSLMVFAALEKSLKIWDNSYVGETTIAPAFKMALSFVEVYLGVYLIYSRDQRRSLWVATFAFLCFATVSSYFYALRTNCGCFGDLPISQKSILFLDWTLLLFLILALLTKNEKSNSPISMESSAKTFVTSVLLLFTVLMTYTGSASLGLESLFGRSRLKVGAFQADKESIPSEQMGERQFSSGTIRIANPSFDEIKVIKIDGACGMRASTSLPMTLLPKSNIELPVAVRNSLSTVGEIPFVIFYHASPRGELQRFRFVASWGIQSPFRLYTFEEPRDDEI